MVDGAKQDYIDEKKLHFILPDYSFKGSVSSPIWIIK